MNSSKTDTTHSEPEQQPPGRWDHFKRHMKMRMHERFSKPRRILEPGMPDWPKYYLRGTETLIVKAKGYIRPKQYLRARNYIMDLKALCAVIFTLGLIIVGPIYVLNDYSIPMHDKYVPYVFYATIAAAAGLFVMPHFMHDRYARWMFRSKTKMIFKPDKIKIKTVTGWATLRHGPYHGLTTRIVRPSSTDVYRFALFDRTGSKGQLAANVYRDSYWIDIVFGSEVVRVTDVYSELSAERLSVGIQTADKIFRQIMEIRDYAIQQAQAVKLEPYDAHLALIDAMQKRWPK